MKLSGVLIFLIILLKFSTISAQQQILPQSSSCDCKGRILLNDSLIIAAESPPGPGLIQEMKFGGSDLFSFEKEHHTIWYELKADYDAWLEFTIFPDRAEDDYDFMLFQLTGAQSCDSIAGGLLRPVRSVISRTDPGIGGITGLHDTAVETHIQRGPGPAFATVLRVDKGERLVLVLDNVYPGGQGHRISLRYREIQTEEPSKPVTSFTRYTLRVLDSLSIPLDAEIRIKPRYSGSAGAEFLLDTVAAEARLILAGGGFYQVSIRKEGYLAYTENIRTRQSVDSIFREIRLEAISIGKSLVFDNVYFRGGSEQFMPGALDALKDIHMLLKENPSIRVEIQGHVNQPYNLISRMGAGESKELSEKRARAVYDYLIRKGIEPSRLSYRGYGNSRMLYPYARDEAEMQKNRRVEIVITEVLNP